MYQSRFQKLILGLSGATSLAIGAFILIAPKMFYAQSGIDIVSDPSLLSELRAQGAGLGAFGALMLAGSLRVSLAYVAMIAAFVVFIGYPFGRLIGMILDGLPSQSVIGALVIEIVIAALLLVAFAPRRMRAEHKAGLTH